MVQFSSFDDIIHQFDQWSLWWNCPLYIAQMLKIDFWVNGHLDNDMLCVSLIKLSQSQYFIWEIHVSLLTSDCLNPAYWLSLFWYWVPRAHIMISWGQVGSSLDWYVFHDLGAIGPILPKMSAKFKCPPLPCIHGWTNLTPSPGLVRAKLYWYALLAPYVILMLYLC